MGKKKLRKIMRAEWNKLRQATTPTPTDFPMSGARTMFTVHRIENGYIMQFFGDEGFHGRMIYCEKETDIPTTLITERAKYAINPHYSAGAQVNLDSTVKSRY